MRGISLLALITCASLTIGCTETQYLKNLTKEQEREIKQLRQELAKAKQGNYQEVAQPQTRMPIPETPAPPAYSPVMAEPVLTPTPTPNVSSPVYETNVPPPPAFSPLNMPAAPAPTPITAPAVTPGSDSASLSTIQKNLSVVLGEAIRQGQIQLESGNRVLGVVIGSDLVFENGQRIAPRIEPYLKAVGDQAARQPNVKVTVEAFSSGPTAPSASSQQAQNVADFLTQRSGLTQRPAAYGRAAAPAGFAPTPDKVRIVLEDR